MIIEWGHFALILALAFSLLLAFLPWRVPQSPLIRRLVWGQALLIGIAYLSLTYSFMMNDFSVAYVAAHSHAQLPWWYRWCAVWGAHEGSLLLWITLLSAWTVVINWAPSPLSPKAKSQALAILGALLSGFLLFLLATSNPFIRSFNLISQAGMDLNPLLQDPGFLFHPPILYTGYVGTAAVFALGLSALWNQEWSRTFAKSLRPWALIGWGFLTVGITLGSWWAYRVLGWGGWWFWDPVENAALLPWLVGTALIHSLMVATKRNAFYGWTLLLIICAFALSLIGTFLVRSGIVTSVHAFASDPTRGVYLLIFLTVVISSSLALLAWRGAYLKSEGSFGFASRETTLLLNNVLLMVSMIMVLLGTLYPLMMEVLNWGKISVGAPYFNSMFIPLFIPVLIMMGIGIHLKWQDTHLKPLYSILKWPLLFTLIVFILLKLLVAHLSFLGAVMISLAAWVLFSHVMWILHQYYFSLPINYGMLLAHLGIAVTTLGISLTLTLSQQKEIILEPKDYVQVGPYHFQFIQTKKIIGANYQGVEAEVVVTHVASQRMITTLLPEKRWYPATQMPIAHAGLQGNLWRDLYVVMGDPVQKEGWIFRIYYKPFVREIWLGGLMVLMGALWSAAQSYGMRRKLYASNRSLPGIRET